MSPWKQISLVVLLAIVAAVLLVFRLPGVADGFTQAFNASYSREFNRAYQNAVNPAGQSGPASVAPRGQMAAPHAPSGTPASVTQLRDQIRQQHMQPTSTDTIGEQLDMGFRDHAWQLVTLPNGAKVLRFEGELLPDAAADVRYSLEESLDRLHLTQPRATIEEAITYIQPGSILQLDFLILPNGRPGKLVSLGTENATLGGAGLPLDAWIDRLLQ